MVWNTYHIVDSKSLSNTGVETIHLPRSEFISQIILRIQGENGDTSNTITASNLETIEATTEKIEVIADGNKTIKSYTGEICRKFATYRDGVVPPHDHSQTANFQQYATFPINFGRFAGDELCVLPAPMYGSLDLKFEYDFGTVSDTAGFNPDDDQEKYDVWVTCAPLTGDYESKRVLVEAKKEDYTSTASGDKRIELTVGDNIWLRQLLVHCYETGIEDGVDITKLQIAQDTNRYTPFTMDWVALQEKNMADRKVTVEENIGWMTGDTDVMRTMLNGITSVVLSDADTISTTSASAFSSAVAGDQITVDVWDLATPSAVTADSAINAIIKCDRIPHTAIIDFDLDDSLRRMLYQGTPIKKSEAILTNGAAGGAVQVVEQRIQTPW